MKQRWWNSGTSDGETAEHLMVEQSNNHDGRVDYFNNSKISDGWTIEHLMVEQWNRDGGTAGGGKVEQWNF